MLTSKECINCIMVWLPFDCANTREGPGKTVNMCRLALDFTASLAFVCALSLKTLLPQCNLSIFFSKTDSFVLKQTYQLIDKTR